MQYYYLHTQSIILFSDPASFHVFHDIMNVLSASTLDIKSTFKRYYFHIQRNNNGQQIALYVNIIQHYEFAINFAVVSGFVFLF